MLVLSTLLLECIVLLVDRLDLDRQLVLVLVLLLLCAIFLLGLGSSLLERLLRLLNSKLALALLVLSDPTIFDVGLELDEVRVLLLELGFDSEESVAKLHAVILHAAQLWNGKGQQPLFASNSASKTHLLVELIHRRVMGLGRRALMVTQNRHLTVRIRVPRNLLVHRGVVQIVFVQQRLERRRGVVGTEHLRRQPFHVRRQVLVQSARVDSVEQSVLVRLAVAFEQPDVLEHLRADLDSVVVPDRVLAEEVEDHVFETIRRVALERDVLAAERATADRVSLVLALLVTSTQSEDVDEVHGGRTLALGHDLRFEVSVIVGTDLVDVFLQVSR